jgi:RNA polymerase sigma factor (TIGR02999 family)
VRLIDARGIRWQDRAHFLAVAAQTMRRILVEFARQRGRQKRGGDFVRVTLDDAQALAPGQSTDLIALNDALSELPTVDPRMSQVVELRFFGGLRVQETADVLNVSAETVMRDWKTAKVWLLRELSQPQPGRQRPRQG